MRSMALPPVAASCRGNLMCSPLPGVAHPNPWSSPLASRIQNMGQLSCIPAYAAHSSLQSQAAGAAGKMKSRPTLHGARAIQPR